MLNQRPLAARQTSLREFQARLTEKLKAAATAPNRNSRLGVLVGSEKFLIRLEEAGEIVPVPTLTPVPLTRDWFRGMCNLRGSLHTVADLARFNGGAFTVIDRDSRLLALNTKLNFNAAILVSRMLGLKNLDNMEIDLEGSNDDFFGAVMRDQDGFAWRELNLTQLAKNEQFLIVGRA
jgi:twitching motility protein PilI